MNLLIKGLLIGASCIANVAAPAAHCEVIFDNFGPGNTHSESASNHISSPKQGNPSNVPNLFATAVTTPSESDFVLSSIELAVSWITGVHELEIFLMGDAGNGPDENKIIEQFTWTDSDLGDVHVLLESTVRPVLEAGTRYWIAGQVSNPDTNLNWWIG